MAMLNTGDGVQGDEDENSFKEAKLQDLESGMSLDIIPRTCYPPNPSLLPTKTDRDPEDGVTPSGEGAIYYRKPQLLSRVGFGREIVNVKSYSALSTHLSRLEDDTLVPGLLVLTVGV